MNEKTFSREEVKVLIKAFHLDSLEGRYNKDLLAWCNNWIKENVVKIEDNPEFPISEVVFFKLKNGKYITSNGTEVTTEFIFNHEHSIFHDNGYVIIKKR
jgi:hypothetical protein